MTPETVNPRPPSAIEADRNNSVNGMRETRGVRSCPSIDKAGH
jgi:hypothetical protein